MPGFERRKGTHGAGRLALALALALPVAARDDAAAQQGSVGGQGSFPTYAPRGVVMNLDNTIGVSGPLNVSNGLGHTLSFWVNAAHSDGVNVLDNPNQTIQSSLSTGCEAGNGIPAPGVCLSFDTSPQGAQLNFNNATGLSAKTDKGDFTSTSPAAAEAGAVWTHYLISLDNANHAAIYVNGVNAVAARKFNLPSPIVKGSFAGPVDMNDGGWFLHGFYYSNNPGGSQYSWYSDIYETNQSIICTGAGTAYPDCPWANTIAPSMLAKFITTTGKPVPLGTNCVNPLGVQPIICLTGDGSAMTVNHGSAAPAQAFGLVGVGGRPMALSGSCTPGATTSFTTSVASSTRSFQAGAGSSAWAVWDITSSGSASLLKNPLGTISAWSGTALTLNAPAPFCPGASDLIVLAGLQIPAMAAALPVGAAPYGPAGMPPHQATVRWIAQDHQQKSSVIGTYGYAVAAERSQNYGGYPIVDGDLLLTITTATNSRTSPATPTCPTPAAGGLGTHDRTGGGLDRHFWGARRHQCGGLAQKPAEPDGLLEDRQCCR